MQPSTHTAIVSPSRKSLIGLFVTLFLAYVFIHQTGFNSAIPVSRLDLLHSLFVHKTFKIDTYSDNTPDKALHNENYYCDKAPGTVILALPSFALAFGLLKLA